MFGLNPSAAACGAATSSIARKALSFLRKPTCARAMSFLLDEAVTVEIEVVWKGERADTHHHRTGDPYRGCRSSSGCSGCADGRGCGDAGPGGQYLGTLMRKLGACSMLLKMNRRRRRSCSPFGVARAARGLLADALLGLLDRGVMVAGVGFHRVLIVGGALAQDLADHGTLTTLRTKCTTCSGRDRALR